VDIDEELLIRGGDWVRIPRQRTLSAASPVGQYGCRLRRRTAMTTEEEKKRFDFEYWRELAATDAAAFETARRQAIAALIESAPEERQRRRMQGLQWRIDRIRDASPNAMDACLKISSMMWDSVLGDDGLLERLRALEAKGPLPVKPRFPAKVIPLAPNSAKDGPEKT
jgi:hypothetical protein